MFGCKKFFCCGTVFSLGGVSDVLAKLTICSFHFEYDLIHYMLQLYPEQKYLVNLDIQVSKPPRCIFDVFGSNLMMFRPFTF